MSEQGTQIPNINGLAEIAGHGEQFASAERDPGSEFEVVLDRLLKESEADSAELFLKESVSDRMWLTAHRGIAARDFLQKTFFDLGNGFPGQVAKSGKAVLTTDLENEPHYLRDRVKSRGFRYYLCEPLPGRNGVVGSLNIASRHKPESITGQRSLVTQLASRIGETVELLQLQAKDAASSLPADPSLDAKQNLEKKLNHALNAIIEFTSAEGGIVLLRDPDSGSLHPWCWKGNYENACATVSRTDRSGCSCPTIAQSKSVVAPTKLKGGPKLCKTAPSGFGRVACLPLKVDDQILGAVSFGYNGREVLPGLLMSVLGAMVERMALEVADAQASISSEQRATVARDLRLLGELNEVVERSLHSSILQMDRADSPNDDSSHLISNELHGVQTILHKHSHEIANGLVREEGEASSTGEMPNKSVAASATPFLDLRCFGKLTVFRNGQQISAPQFKRRRAVKLLKILLTNYGKPVHREMLIEMLWPTNQPAAAAKQLKVIVHDLRHVLQPELSRNEQCSFISWSDGGYAFDISSPHRLDSQEFLSLAQWGKRLENGDEKKSALVAYQSAAALYTGDFLEDERYSDWCASEREFFHESFLTVLRQTATLLLKEGDSEGAIGCYRRALRTDGTLEDVHRELMRQLVARGRRNDALRQYQVCCEILQQELGCSPRVETVQLYRKIEAGT